MKKNLLMAILLMGSFTTVLADDPTQLENMQASLKSEEFDNSKFLETKSHNGKTYIFGKSSSYNKDGKANGGRLLWPNAVYDIRSKMMGGTYHVTVHYRVDEDLVPKDPTIHIGMDLLEPVEVSLNNKNKLFNTARATFRVKLLSGKKHNVKLWLGSEGVQVEKIEVRKAIFNKKDDKDDK